MSLLLVIAKNVEADRCPDMRMEEPIPTFKYLVSRLATDHPNLAYLHVVEPGLSGLNSVQPKRGEV